MTLCFLSRLPPPPPPQPLITCRMSSSSLRTLPPPPSPPPSVSLSANPNSSTPPPPLTCALHCPHSESCSGCTHELNIYRPSVVDEAADFFKSLSLFDFTFDSCKLWGWRCRAKLAVRGSSEKPLIGLYQEGTHNVVDIPDCKAHHPNINAVVELLMKGITALRIEPYNEDEGTGDLRYVQMAVTTYSKVQVSLVWNSRNETSPNSEKLQALANFMWRNGGSTNDVHLIHSVWANFHISSNNAFDTLLRKLHIYVPFGASVTDLYAGAGVIGLSLASTRNCRSVRCIEINKESKVSFEKTVERLPNSIDSSISWHHADTSKEPLSWIVGSDVLIVDPPRKGLDPSLIDALRSISSLKNKARSSSESSSSKDKDKDEKRPWMLRSRDDSVQIGNRMTSEDRKVLPKTLIYISCGWESFKEDCEDLLSNNGWRLEKAHGFNFFPGTQSIEVLAVFKRGQAVNPKKKKSGKKKKHL